MVEPLPGADPGPWLEVSHAEFLEIEPLVDLRVRGQKDLEAAIELEPVHDVGAHPSADTVGSLEEEALDPAGDQVPRTDQPGQTGTDDDDLSHSCAVPPAPSRCARAPPASPSQGPGIALEGTRDP